MSDTSPEPLWVGRLWRRLRHGLLIQEFLDQLSSRGFVFVPYFIAVDSAHNMPEPAIPAGYSVRPLSPEDAQAIHSISMRKRPIESTARLLQEMRCYGIFHGEALAGYTWARFTTVPVPGAGIALFPLASDEAYLLDMYIAPAHRGARLAPWLRAQVMLALEAEGRVTCYSISLAFNRSSRRFKARVGAQERELRLYVQLRFGGLRGLDLRLRSKGPRLRAPARTTTPSAREIAARG